MTSAITLKVANDTDKPVRDLWQKVGLLESKPSMVSLDYPPHITFATYDDIDIGGLQETARKVFQGQKTISLSFDSIRHFEGDPMILWLAPENNPALFKIHENIHSLIDPALCHPLYRPRAWIPHCTLGSQIERDRQEEALALTRTPIEPIDVLLNVADCVTFLPVCVIEEYSLESS